MIHERSGMPVFAQIVQDDGGCEPVIERCITQARVLLTQAASCRREPAPLSKLVLGTQCGGSDALSGITANPAIGYVSDFVVENGGTGSAHRGSRNDRNRKYSGRAGQNAGRGG